MQRTEIASARHRVIHKGAGDELRRFRVEMDILEHDLADALRDAAMDLAFKQKRVQHRADIVDDVVGEDLDLAGFGVDLQFADMDPVREILLLGTIGSAGDEPRLHALGQALRVPGGGGDIGERDGAVGPSDREAAAVEIDVGLGGFEQVCGNRFRLGDDLLGGEIDRRAAEGRGARAAGALADRDLLGVALDVMHLIGIEAEPVADELFVDRLVTHALGD